MNNSSFELGTLAFWYIDRKLTFDSLLNTLLVLGPYEQIEKLIPRNNPGKAFSPTVVVAIEKGAFGSPSTMIANFTYTALVPDM